MVQAIKETIKIIPELVKLPSNNTNIDYDREADVLYITFDRFGSATDSEMVDNVIIRKNKNKIIGLTILNASQFGA